MINKSEIRGSKVIFSDDLLNDLQSALDHKVTDRAILNTLYDGLIGATSSNSALQGNYIKGTFKDAKEGISRLDKALQKLIDKRGQQEKALESINAAIRDLKRFTPEIFSELDAYLGNLRDDFPEDIEKSVFERVAERLEENDVTLLKETTNKALDNLKATGKGGAKKDARKYIAGLQDLMNTFESTLPDWAIYGQNNSLFMGYARYWLQHFTESNVTQPERHIMNALEDRKHWIKLTK